MRKRLKVEQLLEAIAAVADDGFVTASELHLWLPRVSRRDLERGIDGLLEHLAARGR